MTDPNEPTTQVDSGLVAFLETITMWILGVGFLAVVGTIIYIFLNYINILIIGLN